MIGFDEAFECIVNWGRTIGTETVSVETAAFRVLAAPVVARIDSPRRDVSAMDGYAVREADLRVLPATLRVAGESFAGAGWDGIIGAGECARIFTGAPVPTGADRIVIQEQVRRNGQFALVEEEPGTASHIRKRGSDFEAGDQLLPTGRLLDKRAIVAAAGADLDLLEVYLRPRVSILSTGDELAEPGTAAHRRDAIPESVSLGVAALAVGWGGDVIGRQRLRDELAAMEAAAEAAVDGSDLVIITGGASVGEKDFAKRMFEPLGLDLIFSKVAIKPGKPVWLGRVQGTFVMGLPGNPTSAMVTARLLLAPLLAGLCGRAPGDALRWRTATLASPLGGCGPRETFHRATWVQDEVQILGFQDSSAQRALAEAELLVHQCANTPALAAGDPVRVLDF